MVAAAAVLHVPTFTTRATAGSVAGGPLLAQRGAVALVAAAGREGSRAAGADVLASLFIEHVQGQYFDPALMAFSLFRAAR